MDVGYNYAWPSNAYGLWLGPEDRQDRWPPDYAQRWRGLRFKAEITKNLGTLHDNGIRVVRWFLLGNGFTYGMPPSPKLQGYGLYARTAWTFEPPDRIDQLFLDHFVELLKIHREKKMKMIPSLIDYQFFATNKTADKRAGGRSDVATDWKKRNKFLFGTLGEFLKASEPFHDVIEAWEVINEPAWAVRRITPPATGYAVHEPFVEPAAMEEFLRLALAWIDGKRFASTVGHRFLSDLSQMKKVGTKPQFHYYAEPVLDQADPDKLPLANDGAVRGAFIGEFGALVGEGYEQNQTPRKASHGKPWKADLPDGRDIDPKNTVYERLVKLRDLGYQLALLWPDYEDEDVDKVDGLKLSNEKLASVKRFVATK